MTDKYAAKTTGLVNTSHATPGASADPASTHRFTRWLRLDGGLAADIDVQLNAAYIDGHVAQWNAKDGTVYMHTANSGARLPVP